MMPVEDKCHKECGRSMVEILGVLTIIGVLSVVGLMGYRTAQNRHAANRIVHNYHIIATNVLHNLVNKQDDLLKGLDSSYDVTVEKVGDNGFGVYFPKVPKDVCKMILGTNISNTKMAVNNTYYTGNSDICVEDATVQFFHNADDVITDGPDSCSSVCPDGTSCVGGTCCPIANVCKNSCCGQDEAGVQLVCKNN